jgi:hypothetical protein
MVDENVEFLNLLKSPKGTNVERRKNRGDEPIRVLINIYMEMLHGNTLYSYLNQTKMPFLK